VAFFLQVFGLNVFAARTVADVENAIQGVKSLHGFCDRTLERKGVCWFAAVK